MRLIASKKRNQGAGDRNEREVFNPLYLLSGVISPLISRSILGTYRPGDFLFQWCHQSSWTDCSTLKRPRCLCALWTCAHMMQVFFWFVGFYLHMKNICSWFKNIKMSTKLTRKRIIPQILPYFSQQPISIWGAGSFVYLFLFLK